MPLELLQDSDSSLATIGPHWPSSYPEYLSPSQDKDEQQRIVWARLRSQPSKLAKSLREQKERYLALRQELNPRTTQVESSHDPLYRDSAMARGLAQAQQRTTQGQRGAGSQARCMGARVLTVPTGIHDGAELLSTSTPRRAETLPPLGFH